MGASSYIIHLAPILRLSIGAGDASKASEEPFADSAYNVGGRLIFVDLRVARYNVEP